MNISERIRSARLRLAISESELAKNCALSVHELSDVESRPDEFSSTIPAKAALCLCKKLRIDVLELLKIEPPNQEYPSDIAAYITAVRSKANLQPDDLNERIGYEEGFIEGVESGSTDLRSYPIDLALELADATGSPRGAMLAVLQTDGP